MRRSVTRKVMIGMVAATGSVVLAACGQSTTPPEAGSTATQGDVPSLQGSVAGTVWVANEDGGTLSAIDAQTSEVVALRVRMS